MSYRVEKWSGSQIPNPAALREFLESEGYSVYQWSDRPGAVYSRHMHSEDQSHWIISGALELAVEGFGTFVLEAGDRDMMPAGTYHSARVIGDEPVVYLIGEKRDR
jgi:mannose-6-phosphate isomerase-like protein (cupin superfamily)